MAFNSHLIEVRLYDSTEKRELPLYSHGGSNYVPGNPGNRYWIILKNLTNERVLAVLSVDGVNTISGETAGSNQRGYILTPRARIEVKGWRKSMQESAEFYFTKIPDSYASKTGRPDNVGVIGLAVFREKLPAPIPVGIPFSPKTFVFGAPAPSPFEAMPAFGAPTTRAFGIPAPSACFGAAPSAGFGGPAPSACFGAAPPAGGFGGPAPPAGGFGGPAPSAGFGGPAPSAGFGGPAPSAGAFGGPAPSAGAFGGPAGGFGGPAPSAGFGGPAPSAGFGGPAGAFGAMPAPSFGGAFGAPAESSVKLGTGHGERHWDPVNNVKFERRSSHPDDIVTLYYDSVQSLIMRGIMPYYNRQPNPFPMGFCPDP